MTAYRWRRLVAEHARHPFARQSRPPRAYGVPPPNSPLLADALPDADWSDAYAVEIPEEASRRDPQEWADAVFHAPPRWIQLLFGVRELLVRTVGIERGGEHVFDTVSRTDDEVLLGVDQSHLGFRASVLVERDRVVVTTVVKLHNRRGAAYFAVVRTVHPLVVRSMLARAALALADPASGPSGGRSGASTYQPSSGFDVSAGAPQGAPSDGARVQEN